MNVKNSIIILAAAAAASFLAGCAEMEANNTKSMLQESGFHTLTPTTKLQKEIWTAMPAYRVQKVTAKGKMAYVFKDEKAGIAWVGHETEYQRYRNLCIQQKIQQEYYMAYAMDPYWNHRWYGAWGYRSMYW